MSHCFRNYKSHLILEAYIYYGGLAWRSGSGTALLDGGSRDRFPVASLGIFSEATDGTMCPGVDSASENEYQESSWR
jgi:hypothetical protein